MNRLGLHLIVIFLAVTSLLNGQSQNNPITEMGDLKNRPKEQVHLHLNKTGFLKGERIWFKAYVYDQRLQMPSLQTTNLHVGLYDTSGTEIKRKLVYIQDGAGHGDFAVDSTVTGSMYYIRAWTNWMKNYGPDKAFIEQIEILDLEGNTETEGNDDLEIAIRLFPEGGAILADTENIVALGLGSYNPGTLPIREVVLLNSKGDTLINPILINDAGLAKFKFRHESGMDYIVQGRTNNGGVIQKKLPKATQTGISLLVNAINPKRIIVGIHTNDLSRKKYSGKPLELIVEGQNYYQKVTLPLSRTKEQLTLYRDSLPNGINQLQLKNGEGKVLATRSFFNQRQPVDRPYELVKNINSSRDTLEVILSLKEGSKEGFSLSASVMPAETRVYEPSHSIWSTLYLLPYLRTPVYRPGKYFQDTDRDQKYELDMLMLSGALDDDPFKEPADGLLSVGRYEWESGIKVKGWAKNADLENESSVWMYSGSVENTFFGTLRPDKTFQTNAILFEQDSIGFSLINSKGKMREPEIDFSLEPEIVSEKLDARHINIYPRKPFLSPQENWVNPFQVGDQTIVLDEVQLVEKRIPARIQIDARTEVRQISDADRKRRKTVANYLQKLGFKVFMRYNRYYVTWLSNPWMAKGIPILVNGMVESSVSVLQKPLTEVASIAYDPQGFIAINLRMGAYKGSNAQPTYVKFPVSTGFSRPAEFQLPSYMDYENRFFKYFGVIDWNPNITFNPSNSYSYKVPLLKQKKVVLHIEGMGSDGTIISDTHEIAIEE